jgi:glycosyltransferase involved in cell wall biosynthesis
VKISVYTCALDEEKFAERWAESAVDADELVVVDTGSTDRTMDILKTWDVVGRKIKLYPFRFDDAKNAALQAVSSETDVAIQLDMDETLTEGWRARLERAWVPGTTRLRYPYVWSWLRPGHPDRLYHADKIHGRFSHRWRNAVHEVLSPSIPEQVVTIDDCLIEHHSDDTKPRNYLPLLKLSVQEDPFNDRNAHYYARELFFNQLYQEAITEFQRHLALPTARWMPERAASLRYMGKCHEQVKNYQSSYACYVTATLEDPSSREAYVDLAGFLLRQQEWCGVIHFAMKASNIEVGPSNYITERYAREEGPFDLTAVALHNLGQKVAAIDFARKALDLNPQDPRLQENLRVVSE